MKPRRTIFPFPSTSCIVAYRAVHRVLALSAHKHILRDLKRKLGDEFIWPNAG